MGKAILVTKKEEKVTITFHQVYCDEIGRMLTYSSPDIETILLHMVTCKNTFCPTRNYHLVKK